MKDFLQRILHKEEIQQQEPPQERQLLALYRTYASLVGQEKLIIKAGKMGVLPLMQSERFEERLLGLERLVFEDPTLKEAPPKQEISAVLRDIENLLADMLAKKRVEDRIEKKVNEKMEERHQEYLRDIRLQVLRDEEGGETPAMRKKYEELEKMEERSVSKSVMSMLRPASFDEIVGQERALEALRSKLASPYPQHLILYGPPGVGKTTAARIALEEAKRLAYTPFSQDAPFVEVDGTTLRWDPRDITNPLVGSVHDPIYQGARRDLVDSGVPEPKPGLVTDAHGGILFIDEIGEMDIMLQSKLLKVLEDKRVFFESAYYDPNDPQVPPYVRKLFKDGAPADFILIGATTREAEDIAPAIRSRCAEIYFEPLTPQHIQTIVTNAASKLKVTLEEGVAELISEYTIEGRKAVNILADAHGVSLYRQDGTEGRISLEDVYRVAQVSRLTPYVSQKASATSEVGKVFGLGVAGYLGSVLEIEAVAFPAAEKGKGAMRFNETAGSMAKDSVFNAAAVVRKVIGADLADFDLHINIVGGGRIDGPSAGVAITAALISAISGRAVRQDVAVTGEVSIQGRVKAVGGVFEKAYGAKQAGVQVMLIPKENAKDIPEGHLGLNIRPVETVSEALAILLEEKAATPVV